jgi:hypothetical protein
VYKVSFVVMPDLIRHPEGNETPRRKQRGIGKKEFVIMSCPESFCRMIPDLPAGSQAHFVCPRSADSPRRTGMTEYDKAEASFGELDPGD